jgi:hypothetical protein
MKLMTQLIFACTLTLSALSSCSKNDKIEQTGYTGEQQVKAALVGNGWVFQHETVVYGLDDVDHGAGDACKEDDLFTFALSGDASVDWGANDCFGGTIANGSFASWSLLDNGTILKLVYSRDMPGGYSTGDEVYWNVDYITNVKMVLKRKVVEGAGKTYTLYDTYVKQ